MKLHLFSHNRKNLVKVGDIVRKYETPVGTIGKANGQYWAHLHFSVSEGLSVSDLKGYTKGWTKEKVEKYYENPRYIDFDKMFGRSVDVGNRGYDYLDRLGKNFYHPGVDVNGHGGGDSDLGYEFTSSCNGVVVYVSETDEKDGWGKMVIVEEKEIGEEKHCCQELNEAKKVIKELEKKLRDINNISKI